MGMFGDPILSLLAAVLVAAMPLGILVYVLVRQYRAHKERQWIHEETMTALQQGLAVDLPGRKAMTATASTELTASSRPLLESRPKPRGELFWMRAFAAFFGLLGISVGGGIMIAFTITTNAEANEFWPMGLIPISGGVGMMVLYLMLTYSFDTGRGAADPVAKERAPSGES